MKRSSATFLLDIFILSTLGAALDGHDGFLLIGDDIGRVKLPNWLREKTGKELVFETFQGRDFPDDPSKFALVIHCGNCMGNRSETLNRIRLCRDKGVPVTNYGIAIAHLHGILERALSPFPGALKAFREK